MADVTQAVQYLMSLEGNPANHYYSNSPHDSGGETYMGISRRWHPNWEGWQFVDGLKGEKDFPACLNKSDALTAFVNDFYRVGWWDKYSLSFITDQEMPEKFWLSLLTLASITVVKLFRKLSIACHQLRR